MRYTPVLFLPEVVRTVVEANRPGAYVLGSGPRFEVGYTGRSDVCIRRRLSAHNHLYRFDYFIFRYADDSEEAFQLEAEAWHALHQRGATILNKYHPALPAGSGLKCPYCDFAERAKEFLREAM